MLDQIYPLSYIVSLMGLILWFFFQNKKSLSRLMSFAFLGGFFVYLFSLAFASGETSYKMLILFRDLVILGVVSQFFNFFKANTVAFFIMLFILLGVIKFSYWNVLEQTFPQQAIFKNDLSDLPLNADSELLLELSSGAKIESVQGLLDKYKIKANLAFHPELGNLTDLDDYYTLDIPKEFESKKKEIISAFLKHKNVDWIEENEIIQLDDGVEVANQKTSSNFLMNDPGIQQQWGFEPLGADQLHRFLVDSKVQPKRKALIAILDTGVDSKHEDIAGQFKSIQAKSDNDPRGHGTHCAGIAAAVSNNGKGIASLTPNNNYVDVTSVRVLNGMGGGTQKQIIDGILYAADHGADVISMSLGGRSNDRKQIAYEQAIKYAQDQGAIVVVAAGNNSGNAKEISPANAKGVIAVSATNSNNQKAYFSNTVQDVEYGIAAPGEAIYSTIPKNKYATFNGTSMAAPHVSGLLGLMKSIYPELTTDEAFKILHATGKETKNGNLTGRFIQPYAAFMELMD